MITILFIILPLECYARGYYQNGTNDSLKLFRFSENHQW